MAPHAAAEAEQRFRSASLQHARLSCCLRIHPTTPPPSIFPAPLPCTTLSQIKEKEKISLAHLHVSQPNLAPHVVLSARFSAVLHSAKVQRVQRAREREFSTGVSLLKIHRKSVEKQDRQRRRSDGREQTRVITETGGWGCVWISGLGRQLWEVEAGAQQLLNDSE